jgi:hypothetical protein
VRRCRRARPARARLGSLALLPLGFVLAAPPGYAFGAGLVLGVGGALATVALVAGTPVRETWMLRRLEPDPRGGYAPAR